MVNIYVNYASFKSSTVSTSLEMGCIGNWK